MGFGLTHANVLSQLLESVAPTTDSVSTLVPPRYSSPHLSLAYYSTESAPGQGHQ